MINKEKIAEILDNIEKKIAKSLNVPIKMEELFPIVDMDKNKIYYDDGSIGMMFDIIPKSIDGMTKSEYSDYMDKITSVLNVMDNTTYLNFIVISDKEKDDIENNYLKNIIPEEEDNSNQFINNVIEHRYKHIKKYPYLRYKFSVKISNIMDDGKSFYPIEEFEEVARMKIENIIDILKKHFTIEPLEQKDLLLFANSIFNPGDRNYFYDKSNVKEYFENYETSLVRLLSRTYVEDDGNILKFNDTYGRVFNLLRPPANPNPLSIFSLVEYLDSISDTNYIMNISLRKAPEALNKIRRKESFGKTTLANWADRTNKKVSESASNYMEFINDKHYETMAMGVTIGLMSDSLEDLKKDSKKIREPYGWKKCEIIQNNYSAIQEWFGLFPGIYNRSFYEFYSSSYHASHLSNFIAPLSTNSNNYLMFFEDQRGNLINYNILTEKHTLFGGIIFAPPGKGKSAFLNYILFTYIMYYYQKGILNSFILDFGGSYKFLISLVNYYIKEEKDKIVYKELKLEKNVFYNPFDVDFGKKIDKDMITKKTGMVVNFFKAALKDNIDDIEESILNVAVKKTLEKFLLDENNTELKLAEMKLTDTVFDETPCLLKYNRSGYQDLRNFLGAMPNISDMVKVINTDPNIKQTYDFEVKKNLQDKLTYFVSTEIGNIFSQNSTQLLTSKNVVLDMKPIVESDMTGFNLLLFYLYFVQSSWIRFTNWDIKNEKKLYIIDEYNQFASKSPVINQFSRMVYKTGRKEGVDLFLASQNISDFPKDFFNSIGHTFMFEANNEDERREIKEIMGLSDQEKNLLTKITTLPGKFSELLVMSNSNEGKIKNILKFRITPFEYWAFITTTPIETYMKNELIKEFDLIKVINFLSEEFPSGLTRINIENQKEFLSKTKDKFIEWNYKKED